MKVLALDYGRARTGVAVSDPMGPADFTELSCKSPEIAIRPIKGAVSVMPASISARNAATGVAEVIVSLFVCETEIDVEGTSALLPIVIVPALAESSVT